MLSLALVDEGRRGIDPKIEFRWSDTVYILFVVVMHVEYELRVLEWVDSFCSILELGSMYYSRESWAIFMICIVWFYQWKLVT
jgi:hypothetical protein